MYSNEYYRKPISIFLTAAITLIAIMQLTGCTSMALASDQKIILEPVAFSDTQWTGLAVAGDGRLFVNYPRWSDNVPVSVAELVNGNPIPFPDTIMNSWEPGKDPARHLVAVQAVFIDGKNRLWILDPANPQFKGVIPNGPKLLQVDLATNSVVRTYSFGAEVALENSYLNDVRIDTKHEFAYITDSGDGALIVLDLKTGEARRRLDNHPSTASEDVVLTIGGKPWLRGGQKIRVASDGIAYDPIGDYVYYQALTGRTMYRLTASSLRQFDLSEKAVEADIDMVGQTGAADGLIFGPDGKVYISALEHDAILRTTPEGDVETLIQDPSIVWPDSFSFGPDYKLYFTTSRIHEGPAPKGQYGIYRVQLTK
ncbi:MAG: sugar lactone lactonase YvrE [Desulforhopalus sp.]|jgi:sugar lactone lactonase YvrE